MYVYYLAKEHEAALRELVEALSRHTLRYECTDGVAMSECRISEIIRGNAGLRIELTSPQLTQHYIVVVYHYDTEEQARRNESNRPFTVLQYRDDAITFVVGDPDAGTTIHILRVTDGTVLEISQEES